MFFSRAPKYRKSRFPRFISQRFAFAAALTITFMLLMSFAVRASEAATYYVATTGSDGNNGSATYPWATFSKAMSVLQPGDTLLIKDGTYRQKLSITKSGTLSSPITIKAEHDGGAVIDGTTVSLSSGSGLLDVYNQRYLSIEGLVVQHAMSGSNGWTVVYIHGGSDHVTVKRVSAYDAGPNNGHNFAIYNSNYITLEDCAAMTGRGRKNYDINVSDNCTLRRCWGVWNDSQVPSGGGTGSGVNVYNADNNLVENSIVTYRSSLTGFQVSGIGTAHVTHNNTFLGNIAYNNPSPYTLFKDESEEGGSSGNVFTNNVGINGRTGFNQVNVVSTTIRNMTIANVQLRDVNAQNGMALANSSFAPGGSGVYSSGTLTNTYNNYYGLSSNYGGNASQGTGEENLNPSYNTATYGKGAYLMVPTTLKGQGQNGADMGATILYQYEDGVLTNKPLWPWPMEDRIYKETGISVTWEANGGLWKTLNGVYSSTTPTPTADTTAPSTPSGLSASVVSSSQINLAWTASTDNVGVAGYGIYRNGTQIATATSTSYSNTGLTASTTYSYQVAAYDAKGNVSAKSGTVSPTTLVATSSNTGSTTSQACAARISNDLSVHIPVIKYNNQFLWADFAYIPGTTKFRATAAGWITDTSPFNGCSPSTLGANLSIHVPAAIFSGDSYWLDFRYTGNQAIFLLNAAGLN